MLLNLFDFEASHIHAIKIKQKEAIAVVVDKISDASGKERYKESDQLIKNMPYADLRYERFLLE